MSFRTMTPLAHIALQHAQTGNIVPNEISNGSVIGHAGGFSGSGPQDYTEYLFGPECGEYTQADNTTGTRYYPDIEYVTSIQNKSTTISGPAAGNPIEMEVTARSYGSNFDSTQSFLVHHNMHLSVNGDYVPSNLASIMVFLYAGDEVFGKFSRVAIPKTADVPFRYRPVFTKGISL